MSCLTVFGKDKFKCDDKVIEGIKKMKDTFGSNFLPDSPSTVILVSDYD